MSLHLERQRNFHTLYESPIVSVRDYNCSARRGGPKAEVPVDGHNIVLLRRGVFCKHVGRRSLTVDVNQAVFFAEGSTYRVSHPTEFGNRGTIFTPAPPVLNDMLREFDPSSADRTGPPFPFAGGPCDAGVFWLHRELLLRLEAGDAQPLEPMWADETALRLMDEVLAAAFARYGAPPQRRRRGTIADHSDRAEAAKSYLACRMGERLALDDVARAVHASPFHLARLFRERTGVPVHRYLTRLRLRAALERLADGASDLAALALELGFSSHSHFTDAFRREFGRTPSNVRNEVSRRMLREASKNLKA
ncbi:MAG: helix-turn-helix transcriptional regulator [Planctomycetia bacterium]